MIVKVIISEKRSYLDLIFVEKTILSLNGKVKMESGRDVSDLVKSPEHKSQKLQIVWKHGNKVCAKKAMKTR